jgi:hypothetical protein
MLTQGQQLWLVGASDPVDDLACNGRPMTQFFFFFFGQNTSIQFHTYMVPYQPITVPNRSCTITSEGLGQSVGTVGMSGILLIFTTNN